MKPNKYYLRVWTSKKDFEAWVTCEELEFNTLKQAQAFIKKESQTFYKAELGYLDGLEPFEFIDGTSPERFAERINDLISTPKGWRAVSQLLATSTEDERPS